MSECTAAAAPAAAAADEEWLEQQQKMNGYNISKVYSSRSTTAPDTSIFQTPAGFKANYRHSHGCK
jgi:hypothetical protein